MSVPPVLKHWLAIFATLTACLLALWCMKLFIDLAYALVDTLRFVMSLRTLV